MADDAGASMEGKKGHMMAASAVLYAAFQTRYLFMSWPRMTDYYYPEEAKYLFWALKTSHKLVRRLLFSVFQRVLQNRFQQKVEHFLWLDIVDKLYRYSIREQIIENRKVRIHFPWNSNESTRDFFSLSTW